MKKFNWEEFLDRNNKIAVHCKTEEEAKDFCNQMNEHGLKWCDGASYLSNNMFIRYKEETAYDTNGCYCYVDWYKREVYRILEWSDYMSTENGKEQKKQEFTKADLKDGMVVEHRNKKKFMVLENKLINKDSFNGLDTYDKYLKDIQFNDANYDIIKVFIVKIEKIYTLEDIFNPDNLELIWERKEAKEMTTEEMRQKLEELTGENIEVEPSREEMIGVIYKYCRKHKCSKCVIPSDEIGCNFDNYSSDEVKKVYDKVMEDE